VRRASGGGDKLPGSCQTNWKTDCHRSQQITHHLSHMAEMLYAIDEAGYEHDRRTACADSFLLVIRALYYFLLGARGKEAHRLWFVDKDAAAAQN
jgi:hypothetical protein